MKAVQMSLSEDLISEVDRMPGEFPLDFACLEKTECPLRFDRMKGSTLS